MKKIAYDMVFVILNNFVAYIPSWTIRKIVYRCFGLKIGKNSRINMGVKIFSPWKLSIGCNTIINEQCIIDARGGVIIGDNCSISARATIYSASHFVNSVSFEGFTKSIRVGDGVWLCTMSTILPGSLLNDYTVIGANSLFKGESNRCGIYIGVPATLTKYRSIESLELKNQFYFR